VIAEVVEPVDGGFTEEADERRVVLGSEVDFAAESMGSEGMGSWVLEGDSG
jgi:hypothetical protein